ncbi:hypothetical protein [Dyella sp.]|uniref:hypothetical protein n=1 Tax=Dyella sp. TaxID=1869338 RepID=UPI003F7D9C9B
MANYKCKNDKCNEVVAATKKPGKCTKCGKNKGWDLVVTATTTGRDTSDVPEWDNAATTALTAANLVTGNTLSTLGGQHGLPNAACLGAVYDAIEVPAGGSDRNAIYFNAFSANYDNDTSKLAKTDLASNAPFAINSTASHCAERALWKSISGSLTGVTLLGIGQTTRPCLSCCARYRALAASKNITILIYFDKKYDSLPGNTWLLFPATAGTAMYTT